MNEIDALNKQDKANKQEIDRLTKEVTRLNDPMKTLQAELEKATICNQFTNFKSFTKLGDLNKIQSCAPPSKIKSDFYLYYYEVALLKELRSSFNVSGLSDITLLDLLYERRKAIPWFDEM